MHQEEIIEGNQTIYNYCFERENLVKYEDLKLPNYHSDWNAIMEIIKALAEKHSYTIEDFLIKLSASYKPLGFEEIIDIWEAIIAYTQNDKLL